MHVHDNERPSEDGTAVARFRASIKTLDSVLPSSGTVLVLTFRPTGNTSIVYEAAYVR